jgi:acetyltransferase-like isoleucine patch superfamily enzyme
MVKGEKFTFGKVNNNAVLLDSTCNATSDRNEFHGQIKIDRRPTYVGGFTQGPGVDNDFDGPALFVQRADNAGEQILLRNNGPGDNYIRFNCNNTTTPFNNSGNGDWLIGMDNKGGTINSFKIYKSTAFSNSNDNYNFKIDDSGHIFTSGNLTTNSALTVGTDLTVGDDLTVTDDCSIGGKVTLNGSGTDAMIIGENNGYNSRIVVYEADATRRNRLHLGADATCAYVEGTYGTGGSTDLQIRNNGTVSADFEASELYLHTIDNATGTNYMKYDTGTGEVLYASSTRNVKKNIAEISGSDDILKVKSVSYDYKDGSGTDIGFIAEDVAAVNPIFAQYGPDFVYDDNGKRVHKADKWEDNGSGKMIPKKDAFPKGTGPKDRYEKHSDNQVPIDINERALLAHAIQKIQDLEARLKTLENA